LSIVQLSDFHLGASSGLTDPLADLRSALAQIGALVPGPEVVIVSGDLAQNGAAEEYEVARQALAGLSVPIHVLPGNHDDRRALRAAFPIDGEPGGRYHWVAESGGLRLIGCDTILPGCDDGAFPPEELDWLSARLDSDPRTPTLILMHHPPIAIGIPEADAIGLPRADAAALGDVVRRRPGVRAISTGHVHLATTGRLAATTVVTAPSTWRHRPRPDFGGPLQLDDGPAGMLIHSLVDGELVTHTWFFDPPG
jgi:Icc protein